MATILQFPQRNKGRIRKSTGAASEGLLAIHQFAAAGDNIEVFNHHRVEELSRTEYLAYITQTIIKALPEEARGRVKRTALCDAALGQSDFDRIAGACLAGSFKSIT